jgi:hypothetical protein
LLVYINTQNHYRYWQIFWHMTHIEYGQVDDGVWWRRIPTAINRWKTQIIEAGICDFLF